MVKKKNKRKKTAKGKYVKIVKTGTETPLQAIMNSIRDAKKDKKYAQLYTDFLKKKGRTSIVGENQQDITIGITRFNNKGKPVFKTRTKKRKQKLDLKKIISKSKINLGDLKRGDKFYAVEDIVGNAPLPDLMQGAQDPDPPYLHEQAEEELKDYEFDSNDKPRKILYCEFQEISKHEPIFKYTLLNQYPHPNEKDLLITDDNIYEWDFYK